MLYPQHFYKQILSDKLLLAITGRQKSNLSCRFQIIINNNLLLIIYCENIVNVTLLNIYFKTSIDFNTRFSYYFL